MSDMPEEIWIEPEEYDGWVSLSIQDDDDNHSGCIKYTRTDVAKAREDALRAENERLRRGLEKIRNGKESVLDLETSKIQGQEIWTFCPKTIAKQTLAETGE